MLGKIERINKNNKMAGEILRKCFDDDTTNDVSLLKAVVGEYEIEVRGEP